jgi:hypothetical protein
MINFSLAMRSIGAGLLLAPFCLIVCVALRVHTRRMQRRNAEMPQAAAQVVGYKIGSYVAIALLLISVLFWIGLIVALRFSWNRNDVRQIEVEVHNSPDPAAQVEEVIAIQDSTGLSRVFDGLEALQPDDSGGHEHAVGKSYVIRLQRATDGQWSRYRIQLYPDAEPTGGGQRMTGVSRVSLACGKFYLGGFQSPELGNTIRQLVEGREGKGKP